jgi:phosphoribosylaminoimidazole (AIR) synthetase
VEALRGDVGGAVRAVAQVGPGGIPAAVTRIVPEGLKARVDLESYERPAIFRLLAEQGHVAEDELRHGFGLGVGLIAIVSAEASFAAVEALEAVGEAAWMFGDVRAAAAAESAPSRSRAESATGIEALAECREGEICGSSRRCWPAATWRGA